MASCGAPRIAPHAVAPPPPAHTASFLERTSPHTHPKDVVRNASVTVERREGPESVESSFSLMQAVASSCYSHDDPLAVHFLNDYDEPPFALEIDTSDDGSIDEVEIDAPPVSFEHAMCVVKTLAGRPLHTERGPKHLVLAFHPHIWWSEL